MCDLTDPRIVETYTAIVEGSPVNWLILGYNDTRDVISLYSRGSEGLSEFRNHLTDEVLYGFVRIEHKCILITWIPQQVSGVRRARALVHSRSVATFLKHHHTQITASTLEDLNEVSLQTRLKLDSSVNDLGVGHTHPVTVEPSRQRQHAVVHNSSHASSSPRSPTRSAPVEEFVDTHEQLSAPQTSQQTLSQDDDTNPPVPPPRKVMTPLVSPSTSPPPVPPPSTTEDPAAAAAAAIGIDTLDSAEVDPYAPAANYKDHGTIEIEQQQQQQQQQREREAQEEQERQLLIQQEAEKERERQRILAEEEEAEAQRLELERKAREEAEKAAAAAAAAAAEKAAAEAAAAAEKARFIEEQKAEQQRLADEKKLIRQKLLEAEKKKELVLSGYVSVQTQKSPFWSRRYFTIQDKTLSFYRDEMSLRPIIQVDLRNLTRFSNVNVDIEPFIPNAFVLETPQNGAYQLFADNKRDMEIIVTALQTVI
ncbi:hypothetical protein BDF20DRAFT_566505 [Mycotypha africana]|uniref:uncharacterized protein n=1 Tax=Mycotypha africana TaxID=64632 RepID=UPI0023014E42|nr:uncharacterized protein BDF20DRAFT_566505 [Mycotypha africana]KAI8977422.1 hypothetical protein BDF20DRAFT_566505 [Mycotypha africana]